MNLDKIAASIRAALKRGEVALENPLTRDSVNDALRRNRILQEPHDFDNRTLMEAFFRAVIDDWPSATILDYIEPYLEPLRDMRATLNVEEINKDVAVFPDSCRMVDGRQKLVDFKGALRKLVLERKE